MDARLAPGTRLGDIEIEEPLGDGGFATVYRGRQLRLEREVAVKVLSAGLAREDPQVIERFEREIALVRALEHPNVVRLYDHGRSDDGQLWMAMALVRGRSLADELAQTGPMPLARVVPIVRQLLSALAVAHDAGIVHRDLKPANVMLEAQVGLDRDHVTLVDFGIGKLLEGRRGAPDARATLTAHGAMLGTPLYMAPEQLAGDEVTPAADIYALGIVTLELLTGAPPFDGETVMAILQARSRQGIVVPHGLDPGIERFVRACTADDPAARPAHARACAQLLDRVHVTGGDLTLVPTSVADRPATSSQVIAGWDDPSDAGIAVGEPALDDFLLTGNDARGGAATWQASVEPLDDDDDLELFDPGFALDESGASVATGARSAQAAAPDEVPARPAPPAPTVASGPPLDMPLEPFEVTSLADGAPPRQPPSAPRAPRPLPASGGGYRRLLGFVLAVGIVGVLVVLAIDALQEAPQDTRDALDASAERADPEATLEAATPATPEGRTPVGRTIVVAPTPDSDAVRPVYRSSKRTDGGAPPRTRPRSPTSLADDADARLCDQGRLEACVSLGRRLAGARDSGRDEERAAGLFRRACDGGLASGCGNLAALMVEGRGVDYDPQGAATLSARACEDGHAAACFNLGSMYEAGMGVPQSQREARRLFERACHAGFDAGCQALDE